MKNKDLNKFEIECLEWLYDRLENVNYTYTYSDVKNLVYTAFEDGWVDGTLTFSRSEAKNWFFQYWDDIGDYIRLYNLESEENFVLQAYDEEIEMVEMIAYVCTVILTDVYDWYDFKMTDEKLEEIQEFIDSYH